MARGLFVCYSHTLFCSFLVLVVCCFQSVKDLAFQLSPSFRKGTAKIKSFFQSAKFLSKNFQTFFSPASASAVPFGKRVQKYSIFSFPPNKITVFFQKKAIYFFTNTKYPLGPTFIEVDDDNETSVMVETSVDTVSLQST